MTAKNKTGIKQYLLAGPCVPMPRHLLIEITSLCNLKCAMCPKTHHAVNTKENQVMTWEIFSQLLPLLPHIESLDLNGIWGEAFLHPDLYLKMLAAIKKHDTDVYTMSNGVLLTEALARKLVALELNRLVISMDAACAETYAKIRPPGRFNAIIDGLKALQKAKRALGKKQPKVELAFVGMRTNIDEFPQLIRMAADLGVARVNLQAMGEYPGLEGESIAAHDKERGRRIAAEARRIGATCGIDIRLLPEDQFVADRGHQNTLVDSSRHRKQCHDLWNRAVIAATGDVLPCCASPVPMGNLNRNSFAEIWRGPKYNRLRQQFLSGSTPPMCQHCTGMAWVERTPRRELESYVKDLIVPRAKHRLKRHRAIRWLNARRHRWMAR